MAATGKELARTDTVLGQTLFYWLAVGRFYELQDKNLMILPLFKWKVKKTMNAWEEAIASLNKAMSDFINNQNLQGQAISSMRRYLVEVHGTLLQTLVNLMNDYSTNLLLYKDGYYQIDSTIMQSYRVRCLQPFIVI